VFDFRLHSASCFVPGGRSLRKRKRAGAKSLSGTWPFQDTVSDEFGRLGANGLTAALVLGLALAKSAELSTTTNPQPATDGGARLDGFFGRVGPQETGDAMVTGLALAHRPL